MNSYFEIKALPNPEIIQSTVVAYLMQSLHQMLPAYAGRIGLDFPGYGQQRTLGGILRVFGNEVDVVDLRGRAESNPNIASYGLVTSVSPVPASIAQYVSCTRVHARGASRLKRLKLRHQAKGTWTVELESQVITKLEHGLNLPQVNLRSGSTDQRFKLFVRRSVTGSKGTGLFNAYGLSLGEAKLPKF